MTLNMTAISFISLILTGICQAFCCLENTNNTQPDRGDANSVESILNRLKQKAQSVKTYEGQVEYKFMQPLLESQTFRKGILYYAKNDVKSKLRLNFSTRKQDDEVEQRYIEQFIFDGIWLTHIDYQIKSAERRQLAEPNKPVDAFELASRDLPILGFTNIEDLKKQFDIELAKKNSDDQKDVTASNIVSEADGKEQINEFIQLHFRTLSDSIYKDDYTYIDFWIDKKIYLPAKVIAITTEEDVFEIKLLNPKINEKLDEKIFSFKIPKGFTVEIIPLENKKSEQNNRS